MTNNENDAPCKWYQAQTESKDEDCVCPEDALEPDDEISYLKCSTGCCGYQPVEAAACKKEAKMTTTKEERQMSLTFLAKEMTTTMIQNALTHVMHGRMNTRITTEITRDFVDGPSQQDIQLVKHEIQRILSSAIDNAENIVDKL